MSTATRKPAEDTSLLQAAARAWSSDDTPELHEKSLTDCIEKAADESRELTYRLEAILTRARRETNLSAADKNTENQKR